MKQSNFDKWLTTEPDLDDILTQQQIESNEEMCSCCDWNNELQKWNYIDNCEIHKEAK